nr:metal-sulfur cluster assembly factor [Candidatus Parvarchaeota archaeon]MCL5017808.1 metal-sulfur cluster assembly factor [Candidatus Parvarchaeota archaeon]
MEVNVKKEDVIKALKECFDPEIPVNVYDLGLVYNIDLNGTEVKIKMTMTSPFCPVTDYLLEDVKNKVEEIAGATKVDVEITFDPPWNQDKISEEGKAQLGI